MAGDRTQDRDGARVRGVARRSAIAAFVLAVAAVAAGCFPETPPPPPKVVLQVVPSPVVLTAIPYLSGEKTVIVTNTGGGTSGPLRSNIVKPSGVGEFTQPSGTCARTATALRPGESCWLSVMYRNDTGGGTAAGELVITGDGASASVALRGTGLAGGLTISVAGANSNAPAIANMEDSQRYPNQPTHFVVLNNSLRSIGPITVDIVDPSGIGTFSIIGNDCEGITFPSAPTGGCVITVSYTNRTGSGQAQALLVASSGTSSAVALLLGTGV